MESIYFYEDKKAKEVNAILKEDDFMRISFINKMCKALGLDKEGNLLYANGSNEEIALLEEKFKEIGVKKITGSEYKDTLDAIKAEEDNAASGMGMIFG